MHVDPPRTALLRQIAAAIYDGCVCIALLAGSGMTAQLITHGQLFSSSGQLQHGWFRPLQTAVVALYLVASWRRGGQTIGLRAWKLRLVARDGQPLGRWLLLRRLLAISLPWLALLAARMTTPGNAFAMVLLLWTLAYACGLITTDRRTIQDILGGTRICRAD
ncbi:RDD family protein [Frateuria aurantia]